MFKPFDNKLTAAEIERLAILSEELGEAQQAIGKILRHGYSSFNPTKSHLTPNRQELEHELGDVEEAIQKLCRNRDVVYGAIQNRAIEKRHAMKQWIHFEENK